MKCRLILGFLIFQTTVFAQEVTFPELTGPVLQTHKLLSEQQVTELSSKLLDSEKKSGSQIVVAIIPTTEPLTIEQYSIELAEKWKPGRKGIDDGLILLIAVEDRRMRIEVGYGLEGTIPDAIAKQVIDLILIPAFKKKQYNKGINEAVEYLLKRIADENLPSVEELQEKQKAERRAEYARQARIRRYYEYFMYFCFGIAILFGIYCARKGKHLLGYTVPGPALFMLFFLGEYFISSYFSEGYFIFVPALIGYTILMIFFDPAKRKNFFSGSGSSSGSSYRFRTSSYSSSSSRSSSSSVGRYSSSSSYSGGGGSFGGGGASGSW